MSVIRTAKAGDRVLFTGDPSRYGGQKSALSFFKENKVYGTVASIEDSKRYYTPTGHILMGFTPFFTCNGFETGGLRNLMIASTEVTVISPEEYSSSDKWVEDAKMVYNKYTDSLMKECLTVPKISFMNRKFNFEDRTKLETNHSYVIQGRWNADGTFTNVTRQYRPSCCAFTKTQEDLRIWIPQIWLNYFGYTTYDLVEWLKFLGKCGFDFKYEFFGEERLDDFFDSVMPTGEITKNDYHQYINTEKHSSSVYQNGKDGFMSLWLKASSYRQETYMRFICVRYMYNMKYWTIPGHAMQIKKALGALVTHWEALLLAHLHIAYYGYYCFAAQMDLDPTKPSCREATVTNGINYDKHINPYQSCEEVLKAVRSGSSMNMSFGYVENTFKRAELDVFFANQDWMGLYKYTKEKTKKK